MIRALTAADLTAFRALWERGLREEPTSFLLTLDEARANADHWHPALPSAKAIGAAELIAHVRGEMTLDDACSRATILTRQFAKRQRTWFKSRMRGWPRITPDDLAQHFATG